MRLHVRACVCLLAVGLFAGSTGTSEGSITVGHASSGESLRVTASGAAFVSWSENGRRRHVTIRGSQLRYRGMLHGANAGRPVTPDIPLALVELQLPDGTKYALQRLHRYGQFGERGPIELRFSRWHGEPTHLSLTGEWVDGGRMPRICGTATYHGQPFFGYRHTSTGVPLDPEGRNVYLDVQRPQGWYRIMGVLTRPDGFALLIRTTDWRGSAYRGLVPGPNVGADLAPDATATMAMPARSMRHVCPFAPGKYKSS